MKFKNKVAYCTITFPHKGEIDFTAALNLPIVYNSVLDETLDTATIKLTNLRQKDYSAVDVSKAFEPFSLVKIGFSDENGDRQQTEIRMVIAQDAAKMQRKDDTPWKSWTHTVQLVEETKQLERESVDVLTFTNPVERHYDAKANAGWIFDNNKSGNYLKMSGILLRMGNLNESDFLKNAGWQPPVLPMMTAKTDEYSISNNLSTWNSSYWNNDNPVSANDTYDKVDSLQIIVTTPTYNQNTYNFEGQKLIQFKDSNVYKGEDSDLEIPLKQVGEYKIEFLMRAWIKDNTRLAQISYYTYIAVGSGNDQLHNYKISEVLNRTLDLTPTKTASEKSKYQFDAAQLEECSEEAPEFAFTGHTLFEAMLQIAGYKGAFPEMHTDEDENKVISFRPLWNGELKTASELPEPIDEIALSDINQYCTYLETEVQNLVGVNNSRVASVIEPYSGGYKTTRSGTGSEISEDTAIISTTYNIYQSIRLDMGYTDGKQVGDITPYVYEQGEYAALSDTVGVYPISKAYALEWSQMGRNYTELAHRIKPSASSIAQAFTRPAIANIVYAYGGELNSGFLAHILSMLEHKDTSSFADLMFRTEYIPIFNARVKQYKDYFGEFRHDGSIKYNQTAELVDSEMCGEHLKQLIRKIGNATKRCIYIFDTIDEVPKVGTVVDGYSVYDVQMSIRENEVVATISYVKYAELSQYIGVKNAWKDSDVSTKKCYNRAISYNEFLLLTHDDEKESTSKTLSKDALNGITTYTSANPLTCVEATGHYVGGSPLNTVLLPVISLAVGNSLFFQWGYEDNYSAGYMSEKAPEGATSLISGTKYNRAQKAIKYCDMYGRMETYDFSIMPTGPVPDGKNMAWVNASIENSDKIDRTQNIGFLTQSINGNYTIVGYRSGDTAADVFATFQVTLTTGEIHNFDIIFPKDTSESMGWFIDTNIPYSLGESASVDVLSAFSLNVETTTDKATVARNIGYSLPLKPDNLLNACGEKWQGDPYISVENLLVEKNSSEALTFSVQLHYCTDNENFIIGSGLTNFCSLIGGTAEEVALFGFNERINIFNRRFPVDENNRLGNINFEYNEVNNSLETELPEEINNYQAWALMGKDKNGNWQIIFGENRDLKGSDFETELYLLPMHKLEDFV